MKWQAVLIGLCLLIPQAQAGQLFIKGSKSFGVTLGSGTLGIGRHSESYVIAGLSASYFIANHLELGLGYRGWLGGDPTLHQVTVPATYYVPLKAKIKPYVGGFVRQTWSSDNDLFKDYGSYGSRLGVALITSRSSYIAGGWVHEIYADCQYGDCSNDYAEVIFGIGF